MKYKWLDEFLMEMKGVTRDFKEEWNWTRYLLGDKMFAAVCKDDSGADQFITLKLEPLEGDFLRQQYEDIIPGYYMNKVHWNSVKVDGEVPDDLLKDMLEKSYGLVLKKLTKKKQEELLKDKKMYQSRCGVCCDLCERKETVKCTGCINMKGPFWGGVCQVKSCCETKGHNHCGLCEAFPCENLLSMGVEEGFDPKPKIEQCRKWAGE